MIIDVIPDGPKATAGVLIWTDRYGVARRAPCVLGRAGVVAATNKREGDGATPSGAWPLRRVHWREDRLKKIETALPVRAIQPQDGWCDEAKNPAYNTLVSLPFKGRFEVMWRNDGLYDVVVELGYNDAPPIPNKGSAIFMHVMAPDKKPTEGCVALLLDDLLDLLCVCDETTQVRVHKG